MRDTESNSRAFVTKNPPPDSIGHSFTRFKTPLPAVGRRARGGATNPIRQSKAFRNIPSGEFDESSVDVIEVQDQRHPLYGRSFRVIRLVAHRGGNFPPSYEVEYQSGRSLLIPITVTKPYQEGTNQIKLSIEALRELVVAAECLECHEYGSKRSVGGAAARSSASDRRRRRRGAGGDLS